MERKTGQGQSLRHLCHPQSLLSAEALRALTDLNEQCLELLAEQAVRGLPCPYAPPLLRDLRELWPRFNGGALRRASECPYLLVDAGFCDPHLWAWALGHCAQNGSHVMRSTFFTLERAAPVRRFVLTYAWHLARSYGPSAQMLIGAAPHCIELLAACTLRQINDLADRHADWLQPRWCGRVRLWRDLLLASIAGEERLLEQVRMRGLQLLAADVYAALH